MRPRVASANEVPAIEAEGLTRRFGDFVAVDHVNFRIPRGEIFGFLGSNGCGKSTTMKMLTGLLPATEGWAKLFGSPMGSNDMEMRRNVGYMSQAFSLYGELTVRQNLELHAQLYHLPPGEVQGRIDDLLQRYDLKASSTHGPKACRSASNSDCNSRWRCSISRQSSFSMSRHRASTLSRATPSGAR